MAVKESQVRNWQLEGQGCECRLLVANSLFQQRLKSAKKGYRMVPFNLKVLAKLLQLLVCSEFGLW